MRTIPVDLISIDTSQKSALAQRAISKTVFAMREAGYEFNSVTLLNDFPTGKYVKVIPKLAGLEGYSRFVLRELHNHLTAPHCLIVQGDGYVLNAHAWRDDWLKYDYIGAPWLPSGSVGNGGFSLRSRKLLQHTAAADWPMLHPEDYVICGWHREEIEKAGFKIAPASVAQRFSFEGRVWQGKEWWSIPKRWEKQFGFHSWLTKFPPEISRPRVFHHSGDAGDVIYGLAAIKQLGGGVLFMSGDNRFPYPLPSRWQRQGAEASWVDNLQPLIEAQHYIWSCRYTHGTPHSTDFDLNRFREPWHKRTARDYDSILKLHCDAVDVAQPLEPWIEIKDPIVFDSQPIVVAHTERYLNEKFPWPAIVDRWHNRMIFVGTPQEAELFKGMAPHRTVPYAPTKDALQLARVISGAKLFIGNQSLPLAIAHGMHKPVVACEWAGNPNCHLIRDNAFYQWDDKIPTLFGIQA